VAKYTTGDTSEKMIEQLLIDGGYILTETGWRLHFETCQVLVSKFIRSKRSLIRVTDAGRNLFAYVPSTWWWIGLDTVFGVIDFDSEVKESLVEQSLVIGSVTERLETMEEIAEKWDERFGNARPKRMKKIDLVIKAKLGYWCLVRKETKKLGELICNRLIFRSNVIINKKTVLIEMLTLEKHYDKVFGDVGPVVGRVYKLKRLGDCRTKMGKFCIILNRFGGDEIVRTSKQLKFTEVEVIKSRERFRMAEKVKKGKSKSEEIMNGTHRLSLHSYLKSRFDAGAELDERERITKECWQAFQWVITRSGDEKGDYDRFGALVNGVITAIESGVDYDGSSGSGDDSEGDEVRDEISGGKQSDLGLDSAGGSDGAGVKASEGVIADKGGASVEEALSGRNGAESLPGEGQEAEPVSSGETGQEGVEAQKQIPVATPVKGTSMAAPSVQTLVGVTACSKMTENLVHAEIKECVRTMLAEKDNIPRGQIVNACGKSVDKNTTRRLIDEMAVNGELEVEKKRKRYFVKRAVAKATKLDVVEEPQGELAVLVERAAAFVGATDAGKGITGKRLGKELGIKKIKEIKKVVSELCKRDGFRRNDKWRVFLEIAEDATVGHGLVEGVYNYIEGEDGLVGLDELKNVFTMVDFKEVTDSIEVLVLNKRLIKSGDGADAKYKDRPWGVLTAIKGYDEGEGVGYLKLYEAFDCDSEYDSVMDEDGLLAVLDDLVKAGSVDFDDEEDVYRIIDPRRGVVPIKLVVESIDKHKEIKKGSIEWQFDAAVITEELEDVVDALVVREMMQVLEDQKFIKMGDPAQYHIVGGKALECSDEGVTRFKKVVVVADVIRKEDGGLVAVVPDALHEVPELSTSQEKLSRTRIEGNHIAEIVKVMNNVSNDMRGYLYFDPNAVAEELGDFSNMGEITLIIAELLSMEMIESVTDPADGAECFMMAKSGQRLIYWRDGKYGWRGLEGEIPKVDPEVRAHTAKVVAEVQKPKELKKLTKKMKKVSRLMDIKVEEDTGLTAADIVHKAKEVYGDKPKKKAKKGKKKAKAPDLMPVDDLEWEIDYDFEEFNPAQSEALLSGHIQKGKNFLAKLLTGVGKSVLGHVAIKRAIEEEYQIGAWIVPTKALAEEKEIELSTLFPDDNICILTGDHILSKKKQKELNKADIIIMTNEMLNAREIKRDAESNSWLYDIGAMIIDEAHYISSVGRGDVLEVAIMGFCSLNPNCQIGLLSATIDKTEMIAEWITDLTGRDTAIFESDWRPVEITVAYHKYAGVPWDRKKKFDGTVEILEEYDMSNKKALVFCPSRAECKQYADRLAKLGYDTAWHNASLGLKQRRKVESKFLEGSTQVLFATTTLAVGVNLPADIAIVAGIHRGTKLLDPMDVWQCAGRAGRVGFSTEGFVHILACKEEFEKNIEYIKKIEIRSVLGELRSTAFHVNCLIHRGALSVRSDLDTWWQSTLACKLGAKEINGKNIISFLKQQKAVLMKENEFEIQKLGTIAAMFYFYPDDVYSLYHGIRRLGDEWCTDDDVECACALVTPSQYLAENYVSKAEMETVEDWAEDHMAELVAWFGTAKKGSNPTKAKYKHAMRNWAAFQEEPPGHLRSMAGMLRADSPRVFSMLKLVSAKFHLEMTDDLDGMFMRFKHGIPVEVVGLLKLDGVGPKSAMKLWNKGIKTQMDVMEEGKKVRKLIGNSRGKKAVKDARSRLEGF